MGSAPAPPFAAALGRLVADVVDDPAVEVRDLVRLSGGASRETWSFDAVGPAAGQQRLILQREGARDPSTPSVTGIEAASLRAAARAGVPVAELLASDDSDGRLGAPFLLSRFVPGETIARKVLRDERFARARQVLAGDLGRALARVHTIAPADVPGLQPRDELEHYREALYGFGEPHPAFELALRWLDANRPPFATAGFVHGDYRFGNVIVDEGGLAAVIDWELAHLGDPMEDLGWVCIRAWRFGGPQPVAGVGSYDDFLGAYGDEAGRPVDREAFRWYLVSGTLKWGVICRIQAEGHLSGMRRSHELAAIGRRVCENEYDVLELLP
jgi:aminoglycoside phosphotransferase (APT) family kinase protein